MFIKYYIFGIHPSFLIIIINYYYQFICTFTKVQLLFIVVYIRVVYRYYKSCNIFKSFSLFIVLDKCTQYVMKTVIYSFFLFFFFSVTITLCKKENIFSTVINAFYFHRVKSPTCHVPKQTQTQSLSSKNKTLLW